jgi:hypothetical protein
MPIIFLKWTVYATLTLLCSSGLNSYQRVLAINIEEYVPLTTPTIKASAKFLVVSPPKNNNANRISSTATEVDIDLTIV